MLFYDHNICFHKHICFLNRMSSLLVSLYRVLYGSNPLKNKNPNSKAAFKNLTNLVRFETGGKGRRSQRRLLTKYSMAGTPNDGF